MSKIEGMISVINVKSKDKVKIVDVPQINLADDDLVGDVLIKFYRTLGWNGEDFLDPCKVRTTEEVYYRLYDLMLEKYPDPQAIGFAMLNKAPGVDNDISDNKVYLLDGWIIPTG